MIEHAMGIGKAPVVCLSNLRRKAAITTSVTSQDPHFRVLWDALRSARSMRRRRCGAISRADEAEAADACAWEGMWL